MKAVISGATRGIGRAIAIELASKGFTLILLARNEADLKSLSEDLEKDNQKHEYYAVDLTQNKQILKLSQNLKKHNKIELLINNLGIYEMDSPSTIKLDQLQNLIEVNLFSAITLTQQLLPQIENAMHSKIINIGSILALRSDMASASYSISKQAFKAWTDGLREELRNKNIAVSSLYPGAVNTSSWDGVSSVNRNEMIQVEDIAKLVGTLVELGPSCLVEDIVLTPMY